MDTIHIHGSGGEEHMLCFVCVSGLGGEPLVNKGLFVVEEQFNEVRYKYLTFSIFGSWWTNGEASW